MSSYSRTVGAIALSFLVSACFHASAPGDVARTDASVITRSEMEQSQYSSLYDVVQTLRGRWLQSRGPTTLMGRSAEVQVMVDDLRMGGVDALRTIKTDNVVSITFVDPVAAGQRWGGKYAQGTIVVATHADAAPPPPPPTPSR
jgi:hypothetical protein